MLRAADYNGLAVGTSCMGTAKHNVQDDERLIWRNLPTKIDDLNMAERKLTDAQKARIERNRQRALMLRNARLSNRPYPEMKLRDGDASKANSSSEASATISRVVDTGGGFLLDPEEDESQGERNNLVREPGQFIERRVGLKTKGRKILRNLFQYTFFSYFNQCWFILYYRLVSSMISVGLNTLATKLRFLFTLALGCRGGGEGVEIFMPLWTPPEVTS